ncbi:MAG: hypothetical protein HY207_07135 [Nitrospirae bacterium]|nr:hypothetical protein [Nitrospirota bacterium]
MKPSRTGRRSSKAPAAQKPPAGRNPSSKPGPALVQHRTGFVPSLTGGKTTMASRAPRGSRSPKTPKAGHAKR